ncbi:MAG TPA: CotH kinase family protein [Verrucomicrobiae bacterium]|nr:CotH kinase family protein [Verrucomicrobiae bacterium]
MLKRPLLLIWCLFCASAFAAPVFDYGSEWKYFLGVTEASDPDTTAWRQTNFDDSAWQAGPTPIGYANPANNDSELAIATFIPSIQEAGNLSVFFRKKFSGVNPATAQLALNVNVDDGFVAWVNGSEIGRYNFPDGVEPTITGNAPSAIEATIISLQVPIDVLVAGENVLTVQVFNANTGSSDLLFDASLESTVDESAPVVEDTSPPAGAIVSQASNIEVVFNENVQGVNAADLLINGQPATSINAASPRNYIFEFPALADGNVTVQWAANHGITDLSPAQNPFNGGIWGFRVDSSGPPPTVVISEFMADNDSGIKDDDGVRSDWIEILNSGTEVVNLGGWFLTDDGANLTKWRIPSYALGANNYLLIWASGKNRTNTSAQFHTSFKLSPSPSYLALVDSKTNIISEFKPAYPTQRKDVSYGRDAIDPSIKGFFTVPTPGSRNSTSGAGFGPEPVFSMEQGVYTNAFITVSITTTAGEIRYTKDGTAPTAASTLYTAPINITNSTTIKARVFQPGVFPSAIVAKAYMMVDNTVANFSSKLPVIVISTSGKPIADHPAPGSQRTFASIIGVDTFRGVSSTRGQPDYVGQGGISIRGQTSSGFPKKPYRLELEDEYGNDRDSDWFGLPDGSDWVLNNPYSDKPFLQNFLAQELFEKMGHYAVRRRFVEVFINTANRKVTYPSDYHGIFILLEKIKVDKNRVPIERLSAYDNTEPKISGGYMFKKDKPSSGDLDFFTSGGAGFSSQQLKIHEPNPREITGPQFDWLINYINQFEGALYATDWKTRTGANHYSNFIDVDSFVDQHWIVEYAKQIDGYRLSNYFSKDRNGKIKMEPIWDYNLSFGNADYLNGGSSSGWYWNQLGENDHIWLRRLMCGTTGTSTTTGDPDFNQRIADRWSQLRTNVLNSTNVLARVDELAALLNEAAARDFSRWPRLGTYVWPNSPQYVTPTTYAGIITAMKNFIRARYTWIDSQFVIPPKTSIPEGRVPREIPVSLTGTGTIYYTLDGSDPRLPGGAVSAKARVYTGPITIPQTSRLFTRSLSGTKWSGPTAATYIIDTPSLTISEIMYHPAPPTGAATLLYTDEDFEYLEFKNTGTTAINLAGFSITEGVTFTFPSYTLNAGARALVVKNKAAFESRYGTARPVIGEYVGLLDNAGEHIVVLGAFKEPILDFTYNDAWQEATDGPGFSLVLNDETIAADNLNDPASWRGGSSAAGTPGLAESTPAQFPQVVINEALTRPAGGAVAEIELHNLSTTSSADITGWFLTDDFDLPKKFRITAQTIIPPNGYVVFNGNDFRSVDALVPFILDPLEEEIYLFSANAQTNLTGYVYGFKYGTRKIGETIGRSRTSDGRDVFVSQIQPTLGASNSGHAVDPLVINEIMYHPPDVFLNNAWWNNSEDEYIELFNSSTAPISLFDEQHATNRWKLSGGADFVFPAGASLPAGSYALIVNFDPTNATQLAAFKTKYNVPDTAQFFGPYGGNLNNAGEKLKLSYPDAPLANGTVPHIVSEEIEYNNKAPWPTAADGSGFALSRVHPGKFGDDPTHWFATRPTPGAVNIAAVGPIIIQHPASQIGAAGQTIYLHVSAMGQNLRYQWRFNNSNILNATNDTLVLSPLVPAQSGAYTVVVMFADTSSVSKIARVGVGADYDRDGMEDNWELANSFNPFDATDAAGDADADGTSNLQEYIAGTGPRDNASYLAVDGIETTPNAAVTFRAEANRSYSVQYTDTLTPPVWQKLTDVYGGDDGANARIQDPQASATRYYRIVSPALP